MIQQTWLEHIPLSASKCPARSQSAYFYKELLNVNQVHIKSHPQTFWWFLMLPHAFDLEGTGRDIFNWKLKETTNVLCTRRNLGDFSLLVSWLVSFSLKCRCIHHSPSPRCMLMRGWRCKKGVAQDASGQRCAFGELTFVWIWSIPTCGWQLDLLQMWPWGLPWGSHSEDQTCAGIPTTYAAMLQEQLRNTRHPFKLLSIEKSNFEKRLRDIRDTLTTSTLTFILVSAPWQSVFGSFFLVLIWNTCLILCFHNQKHGGNINIALTWKCGNPFAPQVTGDLSSVNLAKLVKAARGCVRLILLDFPNLRSASTEGTDGSCRAWWLCFFAILFSWEIGEMKKLELLTAWKIWNKAEKIIYQRPMSDKG